MNLRPQDAALVSDFLKKGGVIHKLPNPRPADASDVLRYLQDHNVDVQLTGEASTQPKYVYKGEIITLKRLLVIANRHRSRRRLPPFQMANT